MQIDSTQLPQESLIIICNRSAAKRCHWNCSRDRAVRCW